MLIFTSGRLLILRGREGNGACQFLCSRRGLAVNVVSLGHTPNKQLAACPSFLSSHSSLAWAHSHCAPRV